MWGLGWLLTIARFVHENWDRNRQSQPVEPLLDGYQDLKDGFVQLTDNLASQITNLNVALADAFKERKQLKKHYGQEFGKLKRENQECEERCNGLQSQIYSLEDLIKKEKEYAHSRVHEFENFAEFLERDLAAAGIEPKAIQSVLRLIRERQQQRDQEQRRILGLPESPTCD